MFNLTTRKEIAEMTAEMMVESMTEEKKKVFEKACYRNAILTTYYGLGFSTLTVYKEGFYIKFSGTRSGFAAYFKDCDGVLELSRKPADSKLNVIWRADWLNEMPKAFEKILER